MSALNDLRDVLDELAADVDVPMEAVFYGRVPEAKLAAWNYFVFSREKTAKASNRVDWQTHYAVAIVHEDYIPEGLVDAVAAAVEAAGFRWRSDSVDYAYELKGSTGVVVEIAILSFVRPEKRGE